MSERNKTLLKLQQ